MVRYGFESKLSRKLWPWPTLPIIYRFRCPRINCGILLVFSRPVWWWQTPGGSPQIGASCPTLWTQPKQPNRRLPVVSQTSGGRLSLLHTSACLGEAPSPGQILTLHRKEAYFTLKKKSKLYTNNVFVINLSVMGKHCFPMVLTF